MNRITRYREERGLNKNCNYLKVVDGKKTKGNVRERNTLVIYVDIVLFFLKLVKNNSLISCLKAFAFVFDFIPADTLFHNLGTKHERAFWPWMLLLHDNCSLYADLRVLCPWLNGW